MIKDLDRIDILEIVRRLLEDPTCEVSMYAGVRETTPRDAAWKTFKPTEGREIRIKIGNGALNIGTDGQLAPPSSRDQYDDRTDLNLRRTKKE